MYCKKCGKEIPNESSYCNYCGTRQAPKKVVIEFKKPQIIINEDKVRNGILGLGSFLKRFAIALKPLVYHLVLILLITGGSYAIAFVSFYLFKLPPKVDHEGIVLYRSEGVVPVYHPAGKWFNNLPREEYYSYDYKNPSLILPNYRWKYDSDLIEHSRFFDEEATDINKTRKEYLVDKSLDFAYPVSVIVFGICVLFYIVRLFMKFRRWLYKKDN